MGRWGERFTRGRWFAAVWGAPYTVAWRRDGSERCSGLSGMEMVVMVEVMWLLVVLASMTSRCEIEAGSARFLQWGNLRKANALLGVYTLHTLDSV